MRALLLVDIQNDFLPGGALAVPDGDQVVPVGNRLMPKYDIVVATQDWHPANHGSFVSQHPGHQVGDVIQLDGLDQVIWPDHCVQGTAGAELASELDKKRLDYIVQKGTNWNIDSYSGFFDNGQRKATGLAAYLEEKGVDELHVMGLATDYCVKYTALDAVRLGFRTKLLVSGVRGVELSPGDCQRALHEMLAAGISLTD